MITFNDLLHGYQLTTVEILYYLPDHPQLLQTFIWQEYDLPPDFPHLQRFLQFWKDSIEGKLYSVRIESANAFHFPAYKNGVLVDSW